MTMFKNVTIDFAHLNPKFPSKKFKTPGGAGRWEISISTKDKAQKEEWAAAGLKVKLVEEDGSIKYKTTIKRNAQKADGTPSETVRVVNGSLVEIDPASIGGGSVANIKTFEFDFSVPDKDDPKKVISGKTHALISIQVTKHVVYKAKKRADFEEVGETEVVQPLDDEDEDFESTDTVAF